MLLQGLQKGEHRSLPGKTSGASSEFRLIVEELATETSFIGGIGIGGSDKIVAGIAPAEAAAEGHHYDASSLLGEMFQLTWMEAIDHVHYFTVDLDVLRHKCHQPFLVLFVHPEIIERISIEGQGIAPGTQHHPRVSHHWRICHR